MKYETPELTALNAINAIQFDGSPLNKQPNPNPDSTLIKNEVPATYMDWE